MSKPYAEGEIAGVALLKDSINLKAQILDGGAFFSAFQGSVRRAADGTPYIQVLNTGTKGAAFGVLLEFATLEVVAAIRSAIDAALAASEPFNVTLQDDFHDINASCVPDFSQGNWISYGTQRMNAEYLAGVTLRFISTA